MANDKPAADAASQGNAAEDTRSDEFVSESASVGFAEIRGDESHQSASQDDDAFRQSDDAGTGTAAEETPDAAAAREAREDEDSGEVSRSLATAGARDDKGRFSGKKPTDAAKPPKGSKEELDGRVSTRRQQLDSTTRQLREAERKLDEISERISAAEARAVGDKPTHDGKTAEAAGAAAEAAGEKPMPEHPVYAQFDTDEAYEAAVAKWRTDVTTWQKELIAGVKGEVTSAVDAKLGERDHEARFDRAVSTLSSTVTKAAEQHEDWKEATAALKEMRSSWFDGTNPGHKPHGPTPFLTDICRTRLLNGMEDGGHLLYAFGKIALEDPDRAQVLADLLPSTPLRNLLVQVPSSLEPLFEHFSTPEGVEEFNALKAMRPAPMSMALGALLARLSTAERGSATAAHDITSARPAARPPAGRPGVRADAGARSKRLEDMSFEEQMAYEDRLDDEKRKSGIPVY